MQDMLGPAVCPRELEWSPNGRVNGQKELYQADFYWM